MIAWVAGAEMKRRRGRGKLIRVWIANVEVLAFQLNVPFSVSNDYFRLGSRNVINANNGPSQDYPHPDEQTTRSNVTPGFKIFTVSTLCAG